MKKRRINLVRRKPSWYFALDEIRSGCNRKNAEPAEYQ
jgi:hypothetical protein